MKLKDISNLARNSRNQQSSLILKARQLKKLGITPQNLLELKLPKIFKLIKSNKVKKEVINKNGTKKTRNNEKNR